MPQKPLVRRKAKQRARRRLAAWRAAQTTEGTPEKSAKDVKAKK